MALSKLKEVHEYFFARQDINALPSDVQATLQKRKQGNEVLVRLIQLTVVLFFATVYFISPKTTPDEAFNPVPLFLGGYFVISIIGVVWSLRAEIPDWASYCSILFDFGMLYGLIVSFHFQYMQPASFILKAPTLLYVFIFIAVRALRMEVKFVVAAGVVAAFGWLGVIVYVTLLDPSDSMVTKSYIEYMTSNTILVGAEVDKIISIVAVTGVLVLVVNGTNNLLVTAVSEGSAAKEFSRFFDESVAKGIRNSAGKLEAGHGERRSTTVMNVDIRGFTKLAANAEPSAVMTALSVYQGRVVPLIQANEGLIDKFMGDGIMATFGIDDADDFKAKSAIEATEAIILDSMNWHQTEPILAQLGDFQIGIGVASGIVAFGTVGRENRLEMTVIGPAVNLSAKLEKHNKTLGTSCVVAKETWDLAVQQGYIGLLQPVFHTSPIDGMQGEQEIVILSLNKAIPMTPNAAEDRVDRASRNA